MLQYVVLKKDWAKVVQLSKTNPMEGCPMFFAPTLTLARTKDRGGNQPVPIAIPRVVGEGEQSTNDKINSYVWAVSYPLSTRRGQGRTRLSYFSHSLPHGWATKRKELASLSWLQVKKDCKIYFWSFGQMRRRGLLISNRCKDNNQEERNCLCKVKIS
jgi:hypothetical protein